MKVTGSPVKLNSPNAMKATTAITANDCRMRRRTNASNRARSLSTTPGYARGKQARQGRSDDAESLAKRQCALEDERSDISTLGTSAREASRLHPGMWFNSRLA